MKRKLPHLLMSIFMLYTQRVFATKNQFLYEKNIYNYSIDKMKSDRKVINICSDSIQIDRERNIIFSGNVKVRYEDIGLHSNRIELYRKSLDQLANISYFLNIRKRFIFSNKEIQVIGNDLELDLKNKDFVIQHGEYQILGGRGRGKASVVHHVDNRQITWMKTGDFTFCPKEEEIWKLVGSKITYLHKKKVVGIYHATLKIRNIPVFYIPYLKVDIDKQRKHQFDFPKIKYDNLHGVKLSIPYFSKLSPSLYLSFSPEILGTRSIKFRNTLFFLKEPSYGSARLEWIPNFEKINKIAQRNNRIRWLAHFDYDGSYKKYWKVKANYTKTSDVNYFDDFETESGPFKKIDFFKKEFYLGYIRKKYNFFLSYKNYISSNQKKIGYYFFPRFDFLYRASNAKFFNFKLLGQITNFKSEDISLPVAVRLHVEPTIQFPYFLRFGKIYLESSTPFSSYRQSNLNQQGMLNKQPLKRTVNRLVPVLKTGYENMFFLNRERTKVIESDLSYLYIPYVNQEQIGIYDTSVSSFNSFDSLQEKRYFGLDRIDSANQISNHIVIKSYDRNNVEMMHLSVGQTYFFSKHRALLDRIDEKLSNRQRFAIYEHGFWRIHDEWKIRESVQYSMPEKKIMIGNASLTYEGKEDQLFQLNYRYAYAKYIKRFFIERNDSIDSMEDIFQIGISGSYPVSKRTLFRAGCYYDIRSEKTIRKYLKIQYNRGCLNIGINYQNSLSDVQIGKSREVNQISLYFDLINIF